MEKRFNEQMVEANKGDVMAMYEIGRMYERGRGVKEDISKAINWFKKASKKGSDSAHARLGVLYFTGVGFTKSYSKARSHLSTAAKKNNSTAQYYLGQLLEKGYVGKRNYTAALALYKKAAESGHYQAKARIAKVQKAINRSRAETKKAKKAKQANKPANDLMRSILGGNWYRNGKPAGYLPSSGTKCKQKNLDTYKCRSQTLTRKIDKTTITYVTLATLSGFNRSDEFAISYQNSILQMKKDGEQVSEEDEDEDDYSALSSEGLRSSLSHARHTLECSLKENNALVCIKNRSMELVFNDKSEN